MARTTWQEEADLIVVGSSVGGLAAAVLAADRGAQVLLLERSKQLGGGAATEPEHIAAAGSRFQVDAGVEDEPARLVEDLVAAGGEAVDREVAAAIAEQGAPLVAWLADRCALNVELVSADTAGHSRPRLHTTGDHGGATLTAVLTRAASRHSRVNVRTGVLVEHLVRDDAGAVSGVALKADRRGAPQSVAGKVLLACGGYPADDALVGEHCPGLTGLPFRGAAPASGDGLRLGTEAGGSTRRLGDCWVTPFLTIPGDFEITIPLRRMGAILVNQGGRLLDAQGSPQVLAETIRSQPGHVAYLIFDERVATVARGADPFFARTILPKTARRAMTLKDLARQLEIDLAGLSATIEPFGPVLELAPGGAAPVEGLLPPLHAIRVTGARRATLGGLAVDAAARVLDANGRPIPGLYATTSTAAAVGGLGGGTLSGLAALNALGLARLAALDLVASLPPEAA
jgi:succinate dehydrogenase/fumarate reductase flavoprotein subunit